MRPRVANAGCYDPFPPFAQRGVRGDLGGIHLDDYPSHGSIEVHDVVADRLLSVKLDCLDLLAAQLSHSARSLSVIYVRLRARSVSLRLYSIIVGQIPP